MLPAAHCTLEDVAFASGWMNALAEAGKHIVELRASLSGIAGNYAGKLLCKDAFEVVAGHAAIPIADARLEQMRSALSEITSSAKCA